MNTTDSIPWRDAFPDISEEEGPAVCMRAIRRREGLTQKELALKADIPRDIFPKWNIAWTHFYHSGYFRKRALGREVIKIFTLAAMLFYLRISPSVCRANEADYCFPVQSIHDAYFTEGGHNYPAIDIFGNPEDVFVAPVSGIVEDIQQVDEWDEKTSTPEKKGGRWVSILGDDNYRYYGSHLERVSDRIKIGQRVKAGEILGVIGNSGNAKGTPIHLHFGISPAAAVYDWKTRRGTIEPYFFLKCILEKGCHPKSTLAE